MYRAGLPRLLYPLQMGLRPCRHAGLDDVGVDRTHQDLRLEAFLAERFGYVTPAGELRLVSDQRVLRQPFERDAPRGTRTTRSSI